MTAEGKTSAEIALAVSQMYESAVAKIKEKEAEKLRAMMIEKARQTVRKEIFGGTGLNKAQQISWLYEYAKSHSAEIRDYVVQTANARETVDSDV